MHKYQTLIQHAMRKTQDYKTYVKYNFQDTQIK